MSKQKDQIEHLESEVRELKSQVNVLAGAVVKLIEDYEDRQEGAAMIAAVTDMAYELDKAADQAD